MTNPSERLRGREATLPFYCVNSCSFVTLFPGSFPTRPPRDEQERILKILNTLKRESKLSETGIFKFLISCVFSKRRHRGLCRRLKLTPVSDVCEAEAISLLLAPSGLSELPKVRFEFLFNLIGKLTMAHLTGQSWRVIKSYYTGVGPEEGYRHCCADGLLRSLVPSCGAG